jgi:hypothetical protein
MFAVAAGNVNGGLVDFFHGVQVAIMFGLMTNIVQFAWWKVKGKKHLSHWARMRPVYLLMFATILVCTQPVSMLVIGSWASIPNFFFDGGDMGAACGFGGKLPASCGATTCSAVNPDLAVQYIWKKTGCTKDINPLLDTYYNSGLTPMKVASEIELLCKGPYPGLDSSLCHDSDPAFKGCKAVDTVDKNTDFTACADDPFSKASKCAGTCDMDSNALFPNTTKGVLIQIFCTYGGFVVMFCGVFEATGLHKKIMKKWHNLRRAM